MKTINKFSLLLSLLPCFPSQIFGEEINEPIQRNSFDVFIPDLSPGFEISGGVVFLKPSAGNLGWGVITNFLPFITPTWHVEEINPNYQAGFSLGARYMFAKTGIDTQAHWLHLQTSDSQSAQVTPTLQWISPFSQTGPGTADTEYDPTGVGELVRAHATVNFHYDVLNLDAGIYLNVGQNVQMRFFSGLSGARIQQQLVSTFKGNPTPPTISLDNKSKFKGIGPRLGFTTSYKLYKSFQFLGEFGVGLLFGSMQPAQYYFKGSSSALKDLGISVNHEKISSKTISQTVPSLDAKLGFKYGYAFCKQYILSIEAGYMGAFYNNPLSGYETNENILPLELGSLSTGSMKHVQSDFSVNGPYANLSLKF